MAPFLQAAVRPEDIGNLEWLHAVWTFRRDELWVTSPFAAPSLPDLVGVLALRSDQAAGRVQEFWTMQLRMILGQLANLLDLKMKAYAVEDLNLSVQTMGPQRTMPPGLTEAIVDMVVTSDKKSLPDVLRALGCTAQASRAAAAYKEVVQRYLMRLRMEFNSALHVTLCADKSKARGHFHLSTWALVAGRGD